ncbi:uncharacterized protein LOC126763386 [Bactrocera neohumeralis]|uniref:uncharacterized protein LOC126763386 n=1 Tax=Bactrocera neohumeralis TaxID=98809 RepID=UPI002165F309|nr:uncharacterized protein LOC126763386 [Bactrocera neohumeralis]
MPAGSKVDRVVDGGIVKKLRARKTAQICKKRPTQVAAKGQLQRSRGVIVTMSVEQSGGISLKTPEGVATSHSRKISTTSALFSPMGVSIGVVCESTTENKEVIVDMKNCLNDNTKIPMDQMNIVPEIKIPMKTNSKPLIFQFRKDLSFLSDQQIEKLSEFNVNSIQELLNIPFGKLLELKLSNKQLQLLNALVKSEMRGKKNPKEAQPLKAMAEELDKLDANDDDDEKPLVIDESLHTIYENKNVSNIKEERSLEAIEKCFTQIRSVKVPQSRAALKEVRSELTEIIAELNEKENKILDNIRNKKDTVKTDFTEEDVTTTTTPTNPNLQPTVMIRKLPTPLRKQKFNVDADSTTNLDLTISNESEVKTVADVAEAKKPRSAPVQKKAKKRNMKVMNLMECKSNADQEKFDISENADVHISEVSDVKKESDRQSKGLEDRFELMSKIPSLGSPLLTSEIIEIVKFEDSGVVLDESLKFNNQKVCEQDIHSKVPVLTNDLDTSANDLGSNVSLSSKCEDKFEGPIISAKRRIEFDAKANVESGKDTDTVVRISNTPLSPISNEIMSPIKSNFFTYNHESALEINGQCTGIFYLVKEIDLSNISINKPNNLDMLLRSNTADPRLLKFLKKENSTLHSSATFCGINKVVQSDPRRSSSVYNAETFLKQHNQDQSQPTPNMLLYGCLQRSPWYQSLMSTMKIQINQTISILVRAINNFQKIRLSDPYAVFDIFKIYCAGELLEILENLGLFVDVNGVIYEKKNMSSYGGRSYGCASVVNATYSFIQPVEPQSVTVQQQMRSFTSRATNFSALPTTFQPSESFISCYIDSPRVATNKSPQMPQSYLRRSKPSSYRAPLPSVPPRRHCGLKVPYPSNTAPTRSSLSPIKRQPRCSDSEEENWDLDENIKSSTPLKPPLSPSSA